jgi:hypothetical protein
MVRIVTVPSYVHFCTEPETTEQFHYKLSTTVYELISRSAAWRPGSYDLVIR